MATGCSACISTHRGSAWKCALMPHIAVWVGQSGWRSVMVATGGPARARVSARRRASRSRYRPAMCRTRFAAPPAGIPAAVTSSGRTEDPRRTGTAWVAVRNLDLATPITGRPNSACARAPGWPWIAQLGQGRDKIGGHDKVVAGEGRLALPGTRPPPQLTGPGKMMYTAAATPMGPNSGEVPASHPALPAAVAPVHTDQYRRSLYISAQGRGERKAATWPSGGARNACCRQAVVRLPVTEGGQAPNGGRTRSRYARQSGLAC